MNCLNISVCEFTATRDSFSVVAWNQRGQRASSVIRLPVLGSSWSVTGPSGDAVPSQVTPIDERTKSLPLLYINAYKLSDEKLALMRKSLENTATHILTFTASIEDV